MNYLLKNWLGIVLLTLGIFVIVVGWKSDVRVADSATWPSTEGTVAKSSIITKQRPRRRKQSVRKRTVQLAEIQFSYRIEDVELRHKQTRFEGQSPFQITKKYPAGSAVTVYYNPNDFNDSLLERPTGSNSAVIYSMGVAFVLCGFASLFAPVLLKNRNRKSALQISAAA